MCVCALVSKVLFNAADWAVEASSFFSTAGKRKQICKSVLWEFWRGLWYLAGEQLGGLEHNYKVDDLTVVAMAPSWYPLSFLLKPLKYSINLDFIVFCPSPKVLLTALYVVCWLRTSILFITSPVLFSHIPLLEYGLSAGTTQHTGNRTKAW